ncbi:MAG: ribosome biogenesis GTPase Der [Myxococcales bacterium]|jgi:GTP-binding protein|nr:ribosome biogenesis GTPase Der [Myxococcales bacterium]
MTDTPTPIPNADDLNLDQNEDEASASSAPRPIVALVGRPNVGKSTLFNRLAGHRRALVEDIPGVTRDRHYADVTYEGRAFTLVDTGGFLPDTEDKLLQRVRDQAQLAIEEASSVILVVDAMAGMSAADEEVARLLRKSGKPVIVAANKIDSEKRAIEGLATDFYKLGFPALYAISAEHGRGVGDLMDELIESFPDLEDESEGEGAGEAEDVCRVAIIGRPNVGKSTLVNRLLGEERMVASDVPGTTTDAVDARLIFQDRPFVLTDTAGIRRKSAISARVEQFSVMRALKAIDRADVALLILDATEAAVDQDLRLASIAIEKGKGMVVLVNKWDLAEAEGIKPKPFEEELRKRLPFLSYAPIVFGSALTGKAVFRAIKLAGELSDQLKARLPTPQLNALLQRIIDAHPAPLYAGHPVRLFYISQLSERPPTFTITCNRPEGVTEDYKRFIVNRMREALGLRVPIRIFMRSKSKKEFVPKPDHKPLRRSNGKFRITARVKTKHWNK